MVSKVVRPFGRVTRQAVCVHHMHCIYQMQAGHVVCCTCLWPRDLFLLYLGAFRQRPACKFNSPHTEAAGVASRRRFCCVAAVRRRQISHSLSLLTCPGLVVRGSWRSLCVHISYFQRTKWVSLLDRSVSSRLHECMFRRGPRGQLIRGSHNATNTKLHRPQDKKRVSAFVGRGTFFL